MESPSPEINKSREREGRDVTSRFYYDHFMRRWMAQMEPTDKIEAGFKKVRYYPGTDTNKGKLKYALNGARLIFGKLFKRKSEEFKKLLDDLSEKTFSTDEDMLNSVIDAVHEFAINKENGFTREELEQRYVENRTTRIPLNELMDFNVDNADVLSARIHMVGSSNITPGKIREAFKKLAIKLQSGSEGSAFRKIEKIIGTSWLVKERPEIWENFGFTLLEPNEKDVQTGVRKIEMSREKFLEKYGINSKSQ